MMNQMLVYQPVVQITRILISIIIIIIIIIVDHLLCTLTNSEMKIQELS